MCLATFPKVIVCGLNKSVSGFAVTMLPLFDVVVAEALTIFSLPHASIGANPEGISILQCSQKVNANAVSSKLRKNLKNDLLIYYITLFR